MSIINNLKIKRIEAEIERSKLHTLEDACYSVNPVIINGDEYVVARIEINREVDRSCVYHGDDPRFQRCEPIMDCVSLELHSVNRVSESGNES